MWRVAVCSLLLCTLACGASKPKPSSVTTASATPALSPLAQCAQTLQPYLIQAEALPQPLNGALTGYLGHVQASLTTLTGLSQQATTLTRQLQAVTCPPGGGTLLTTLQQAVNQFAGAAYDGQRALTGFSTSPPLPTVDITHPGGVDAFTRATTRLSGDLDLMSKALDEVTAGNQTMTQVTSLINSAPR